MIPTTANHHHRIADHAPAFPVGMCDRHASRPELVTAMGELMTAWENPAAARAFLSAIIALDDPARVYLIATIAPAMEGHPITRELAAAGIRVAVKHDPPAGFLFRVHLPHARRALVQVQADGVFVEISEEGWATNLLRVDPGAVDLPIRPSEFLVADLAPVVC